jgi:hypothetical protein
MMKVLKNFVILSLIVMGATSYAETAIEIQGDEAFYQVAARLDDLWSDATGFLVTSDAAHKNLFNIYGFKGKRAFFGRVEESSKLKTASFLARVASDYYDETSKKWMSVSGMGTLVSVNLKNSQGQMVQQLAVLTASHVSQGTRLRIEDSEGHKLPIIPGLRLANVDEDVEIIFLQGQMSSTLSFDERTQMFTSKNFDLNQVWTEKNHPINYASFDVSMKDHVAVLTQDIPNLKYALGGLDFYYLNDATQKIVGSTQKEKAAYVWDHFGSLQKPLVGRGWMSWAKMPPGLSGAPLIRDMPNSQLVKAGIYNLQLDGLVLAQHRFQKKAFYIDADVLRELVQKFRNGQRSYTSPTRWHLAGGLTYRDYGNGKLEAAFTSKPSANFMQQDSGNAVSIDSGNAVSIDSGNAVSIDSGNTGSQNGIQLLWGSQDGYGKKVVGHILKRNNQSLAIVSTPNIEQGAAKLGFKSVETITAATDLYKLAEIKSKYINHLEPIRVDMQCYYKLNPSSGLLLAIYQAREVSDGMGNPGLDRQLYRSIELSRKELAQGLFLNSLRYEGRITIDISEFFITDFSSINPLSGIEGTLGPSVILTAESGEAAKINCYKTSNELAQAVNTFGNEVTMKAYNNIRSFYEK